MAQSCLSEGLTSALSSRHPLSHLHCLIPPKVWSGTALVAFSRTHFSLVRSLVHHLSLPGTLRVQGHLDPTPNVPSKGKDRAPKEPKLEDL